MRPRTWTGSSALLLLIALGPAWATDDEDCLQCHGEKGTDAPYVAASVLATSAHAKQHCVECHADADSLPHAEKLAQVSCARCHKEVGQKYDQSIHGQAHAAGKKEAPYCTDCHGEHRILSPKLPGSFVSAGAITKTCAQCHASERIALKFGMPVDRLQSYLDSYHGLAYRRGDVRVANCASCHGYHDILPSSDARSSIHPSNLPMTCGRCHAGAGQQLTGMKVHFTPEAKHWAVGLAREIYWVLIPFTIAFCLLHNGLDLLRKAVAAHPASPAEEGLRLTVHERLQHAVLASCFVLLAYSGFALKFPEATWVKWLAPFSEATRRSLHRYTALVFCALAVYHLLYLAFSARGRSVLKGLFPRWHDVRALFQHFTHVVGLRREPAERRGDWHYPEKVEYWAMVWGSAVMMITGGALVFAGYALRHLPPWTSDLATVIHYYEAVLACVSIVMWHGYMVVFDPHVYPMNWAWLTGRVRLRGARGSSR